MARAAERKERLTVSVSQESAAYVKEYSAAEKLHVSTVIEGLIEELRRNRELALLNANITAFYDRLPEGEIQEQALWGQLGVEELAAFESEMDQASTPPAAHQDRS
jgi:hypothetical protein